MNTLIHGQDIPALLKYPRTPHLEGSRLQDGDEGHEHVPYARLAGRHIVIEEKLDGGNSGVSFNHGGEQLLQSRGHYLAGGGRERQFNLFKRWASAHEGALLEKLEDRYVMYGEWLHKKHSVFYDALPHYFAEFDIWDRSKEAFLSTPARSALLAGAPVLAVPVLYQGIAPRTLREFRELVSCAARGKAGRQDWLPPSLAKSRAWRTRFEQVIAAEGLDLDRAWQQCDKSDLTEGLYIKVEENGRTIERYKWVRADFVQAILESARHHADQPFVPNQLRPGVDIYAPVLTHTWQESTA
ncbi:RNA ligase family protein [Janthinobacterium aquaticum]|uniref:RNA ligase family protein n=1 Tax=Janthinobacterium sp. FT58W TaxID=2654254 RepID=UPI001264350D|nr:RNA ligase family protein [Janthinobacterium sp. FT58W]KAB8044922.1 DNA ligase [Janthinobacterium sp. FT58W]